MSFISLIDSSANIIIRLSVYFSVCLPLYLPISLLICLLYVRISFVMRSRRNEVVFIQYNLKKHNNLSQKGKCTFQIVSALYPTLNNGEILNVKLPRKSLKKIMV